MNLILLTDSYKMTHWKQYPMGTEKVYSYFESRGGRFLQTAFFGLQYFLKKYLVGEVLTWEMLQEAWDFAKVHFNRSDCFNIDGWRSLVKKHGGRLPVSIRAVPEGTVVPTRNVLMTIENTDDEFPWLTNYLETLLVQTWYPTTVATLSREIRQLILKNLRATGDESLVDFKLHDFGFRGVSSVESAGIGGAAHLLNFKGTDTLAGIVVARDFYSEPMAGFSIPATEHSTITSWGRTREADAMENMLTQFPTGLIACVSDSYDIFKACSDIWGDKLRAQVLARDGCLVVRPDSGDPPEVVCKVLDLLGEAFGADTNEKGFRVLNPKVRVIQGDGVDYEMIEEVLSKMEARRWSSDNIAFGMGGALLQRLNRDTQNFAFKCSAVTVNGEDRDVYKAPIAHVKVSKAGRLKLTCVERAHGSVYRTVPQDVSFQKDELVEVFRDGDLLIDQKFSDIRERAKISTIYWE